MAEPDKPRASETLRAGADASKTGARAVADIAAGNYAGGAIKAAKTAKQLTSTPAGRTAGLMLLLANPVTMSMAVGLIVIALIMAALTPMATTLTSGAQTNQQVGIQNEATRKYAADTRFTQEETVAIKDVAAEYGIPWEVLAATYHVQKNGTDGQGNLTGATSPAGGGIPGGGWTSPMTAKYAVTSFFGPRSAPLPGASTNHGALDLASTSKGNPPVVAAAAGTVTHASPQDPNNLKAGCGNYILIDHGQGYVTMYCHLDSMSVKVGDQVQLGQQIGAEGTTGNSTGDHLHFALKLNGVKQDPLPFFKKCGIDFLASDVYDAANPKIGCKSDNATTAAAPTSPVTAAAVATVASRVALLPADANPRMVGALAEAPENLRQIFITVGKKFGISPNWLAAVAKTESGFDPNQVTHGSFGDAKGLMQLMPDNIEEEGVTDPFDPTQSTQAAAKEYVIFIRKYGPEKALRAYNAGPARIQASYGYAETNGYVKKILGDPGVAAALPEVLGQVSDLSGVGKTPGADSELDISQSCSAVTATGAAGANVWDKIATCEASGNWAANTGNGFYGGLQFTKNTWTTTVASLGLTGKYPDMAYKATREQQIWVAQKVLADQGPNAWPECGPKAGLTAQNGVVLTAAPAAGPATASGSVSVNTGGAGAVAGVGGVALDKPVTDVDSYSENGMTIDGIRFARAIHAKFPQIKSMGGVGARPQRGGTSDHPRGAGIDVMIPNWNTPEGKALGDQVLAYAIDNDATFHLKYAIWQQWTHFPASRHRTDYKMKDRSAEPGPDETNNHFDHVHVSVVGGGYPNGSENYGTAPEGGCISGQSTEEEGIGPLKILPSALTEEEKTLATDLRWSLRWYANRVRYGTSSPDPGGTPSGAATSAATTAAAAAPVAATGPNGGITGKGWDLATGLDSGMVMNADGKAKIDETIASGQAIRADYSQAMAQVALEGMDADKAKTIFDDAIAWHTGNTVSANNCLPQIDSGDGAATTASAPTTADPTAAAAPGATPSPTTATVDLGAPSGTLALSGVTKLKHWDGNTIDIGPAQIHNVQIALGVADKMGITTRGKIVMLETMGVESEYLNLASEKNPASIALPHDKVAKGDLDSVGLFQQRDSWGTIAERMNQAKTTELFLKELLRKDKDYETSSKTEGAIAQHVQVSAYPDRYDKEKEAAAWLLANVGGIDIGGLSNCASANSADAAAVDGGAIIAEASKYLGRPYVWGANGPSSFDCTGYVRYVYSQLGIMPAGFPRQTDAMEAWAKSKGYWVNGTAGVQPGYPLYRPGHVVLFAGNGKYVHAPHTGDVVKFANFREDQGWTGYIDLSKIPGLNLPGGSATGTAAPTAGATP